MAADFTFLTKTLYDLHKAQEPAGVKGSPLVQLVVENFDEEQIWQELELQNSAALKYFENVVAEAVSDDTLMVLADDEEEKGENIEEQDEETGDENVDEEEEVEPPRQTKKMAEEENYTDEDSDVDFDVTALEKREEQKKRDIRMKESLKKVIPSEVDDRFFKLSEMESFLDDMDKREGKEGNEDNVDYFLDLPSDEDDDLELENVISTKKQKKENTVYILWLYT